MLLFLVPVLGSPTIGYCLWYAADSVLVFVVVFKIEITANRSKMNPDVWLDTHVSMHFGSLFTRKRCFGSLKYQVWKTPARMDIRDALWHCFISFIDVRLCYITACCFGMFLIMLFEFLCGRAYFSKLTWKKFCKKYPCTCECSLMVPWLKTWKLLGKHSGILGRCTNKLPHDT